MCNSTRKVVICVILKTYLNQRETYLLEAKVNNNIRQAGHPRLDRATPKKFRSRGQSDMDPGTSWSGTG